MAYPKSIVLTAYSEQWPRMFQGLKEVFTVHLPGLAVEIEHVGSTAVPGLKAKPIIDIDIIVADADKLREAIPRLEALGYRHAGNQGIAGREAFKRTSVLVPLDGSGKAWPEHHLYVCLLGSLSLRNHLEFRDFLRSHPEQAQAYGRLKEELALQFPDQTSRYVEGKTAFVLAILDELGFEATSLALIRAQNGLPAKSAPFGASLAPHDS